ncbi:MAG: DHA2 family efflux MFS transporter permease subunit [Alphaproteobacteria bacterium]|nr:DHA2 family efflux MFS transporter permease subunit [Alphaproteobacteria bacterium]
MSKTEAAPRPLQGIELILAGVILACANFAAVLDMTIVNVSISHIAGSLAISPVEGTYAITSYAVAEAVMVPLTGWLAARFGSVRVFVTSIFMFGIFSALCGFSTSLSMLIVGRILQGLAGGPLMPLSQTLLMQVYPQNKRATALGLWSVTTLVAPVVGPYLGGYICDNWAWPNIFMINIPIALLCALGSWRLLKRFDNKPVRDKVDFVGLILLVVWVGALQIMVDKGKEYDWFESKIIIALAIVTVIGFLCFVIWELTEEKPIVNLRIFGNRGYSTSILTLCLSFGSCFGTLVIVPLWLQNYMGYTATWSGMVSACTGVLAIMAAPFAAKLAVKLDARYVVFFSVLWLGATTLYLSFSATNMTLAQISIPLLLNGLGMPFFFIPLTNLALSSVDPKDVASASGLLSFSRTLSGAIATSIVTTSWDNQISRFHEELAGIITSSQYATIPRALIDYAVQIQSVMLATDHIFMVAGFTFALAAGAIWLAPKPTRVADTAGAH